MRVPKRKKEEIIQAYHNGEIKEIDGLLYWVPSRFFVLGITPSMVKRVIRSIKKGGG
jgi:Na+-transporting NADH:ubiquinone oxidoreductase subunit NqrD